MRKGNVMSDRCFYTHEWREMVTGGEVKKRMILMVKVIMILE